MDPTLVNDCHFSFWVGEETSMVLTSITDMIRTYVFIFVSFLISGSLDWILVSGKALHLRSVANCQDNVFHCVHKGPLTLVYLYSVERPNNFCYTITLKSIMKAGAKKAKNLLNNFSSS